MLISPPTLYCYCCKSEAKISATIIRISQRNRDTLSRLFGIIKVHRKEKAVSQTYRALNRRSAYALCTHISAIQHLRNVVYQGRRITGEIIRLGGHHVCNVVSLEAAHLTPKFCGFLYPPYFPPRLFEIIEIFYIARRYTDEQDKIRIGSLSMIVLECGIPLVRVRRLGYYIISLFTLEAFKESIDVCRDYVDEVFFPNSVSFYCCIYLDRKIWTVK